VSDRGYWLSSDFIGKAGLALALVVGVAGCEGTQVRRIANADGGRDPHQFATARQLYLAPPAAAWDARGQELLTRIHDLLQRGPECQRSAAADDWWLSLAELNKYRTCREVQAAIAPWADRCAQFAQRNSRPAPTAELFASANQLYRQSKFGAASQTYAEILVLAPTHLDARNNLALAQLHKGNDLLAQLQWEILRRLSPRYVPARINLTVLYERLGLREQGQAVAGEALQLAPEVPAAVFNSAWLKNVQGDHRAAEQQLRPLAELECSPRLLEFYRLVQRQAKS